MNIDVDLAKQLNSIPSSPSFDRTYINSAFSIMFPEKRLRRQVKKGIARQDILKKFRDSERYQLMKGNVLSKTCDRLQVDL